MCKIRIIVALYQIRGRIGSDLRHGGFITDALDLLNEWHEDKKMKAPAVIVPYGEELSDVTWAMGKANLLIRNVSDTQKDVYDQTKDLSAHIENGDTLG